ncbi:hypothetical protein QOZ80_1AG0029860 [Eleusine coracana subsp. coracana]|nr:hypothetical protein QOZ80_1AG0029860 [Eleusine coracana subsp. coracana]
MANPAIDNPIIAAVIDNIAGRALDVDVIQGLVSQVRAQASANAAAYFEADAQLMEARRLLMAAAENYAARRPPPEEEKQEQPQQEEEEEEEEQQQKHEEEEEEEHQQEAGEEVAAALAWLMELDDPEVVARAAAYMEVLSRVDQLWQRHRLLTQALAFLVLLRAIAFAATRARLLPRLLLAVAAAYVIVYVASWGRVVPGPASLARITVLVLCFLLGRGPCLMLGA